MNIKLKSFSSTFLFIAVFMCWAVLALGQVSTFYQTYHYGYSEKAFAMEPTPDGGYIMSGFAGVDIGVNRILIIKTDSLGNEEWHKIYGNPYANRSWAVIPLDDGGYMVGAETSGDEISAGTYRDIYLLRLDAQGDTLWTKTLYEEGVEALYDMELCADGGFIIAGGKKKDDEYFADAYALKVDSLGNKEWDYVGRVGEEDRIDVFFEVEILPDSSYVFGGDTEGYIDSLFTQAYLVRLDASGQEIWTKDYGYWDYWELGRGGMLVDEYGIVLGGATARSGLGLKLFLLKVDFNGDTIWTKVMDRGETEFAVSAMSLARNGNYLIAVSDYNLKPEGGGGGDFVLLEITPEKELVWLEDVLFGPNLELAHDLVQTPDGSIVIAGEGSNSCSGCAFLMKIGEPKAEVPIIDTLPVYVGPLLIYPNPTIGFLHIQLSHEEEMEEPVVAIDLYSTLGQLLQSYPLSQQTELSLDVSWLASGTYPLVLRGLSGEILGREVIVKVNP